MNTPPRFDVVAFETGALPLSFSLLFRGCSIALSASRRCVSSFFGFAVVMAALGGDVTEDLVSLAREGLVRFTPSRAEMSGAVYE